jgi:hypothetical protein
MMAERGAFDKVELRLLIMDRERSTLGIGERMAGRD